MIVRTTTISGFSLLEMSLVLIIVSVLGGLSLLAWHTASQHQRLRQLTQTLAMRLHQARMYALQTQHAILFCGSQNQQSCDGHWSKGQLLRDLDTQKVIARYHLIPPTDQLSWKSSLGKNRQLVFYANGSSPQQGSFYLCQRKKMQNCCRLVVTHSGRIRVV